MKLSPRQREALKIVSDGLFYPCLVEEDDGWHARWRGINSDNDWVDGFVREPLVTRLTEDAEEQKHETLHDAWMMALQSQTGLVAWDPRECAEFARELEDWSGSAREDVEARRSIVFRLVSEERRFRIACAAPKGRRQLKALGSATYICGVLRGMRRHPDGLSVDLSHADAEEFVSRGAAELRDADYGVEGVDFSAPVTAEADLNAPEARDGGAVTMNLTVRVAGEPVTADEIRFLLDQGSTLVYFRDHWIEVDRSILKEALRALERCGGKVSSPIGFALGIGRIGPLEIETVRSHGWVRGLVNELRSHGKDGALYDDANDAAISGFVGELRDYQRRGVNWLRFMTDNGFGALLADDMGLGKTVQTIAWLVATRRNTSAPALVVAPLTLLANWAHEFATFAPSLRIYVHQGEFRHLGSGFMRTVAETDVVVTSYSLLVREYSSFSEVAWDSLVIDEAQTIKNPDTQIARAVCALRPSRRIALTGTPVENSVADIWSIEEFLNPTFLGDRPSFVERFVRPIARNGGDAAPGKLRHALEPFVLRRLKTDPRIAAELGPKREIKEYCRLTADERAAYEAALDDFRVNDHRSGDVLALLTTLKLVCDGNGKLERFLELVASIFAAGESVLVFTQYAKIGAWLRDEMEKRFGKRFPFLHGGLSVSRREEEIRDFNRPGARAFLLSLKAGGFGLNLVKATHVIHFDRWWNPAVENQATDRAHRIGQGGTVFVHLMITVGTLEEHVDEMLVKKSRVAESVITEAEWLEAVRLDVKA